MRPSEYSKGLRASEITPLFQFFLAGILIGEALAVGRIIGALLNKHLATSGLDISILSISGLSLATCLVYAGSRGACADTWKILKSLRIDLLFVLSLGFFLSFSSDGFANEFYAKHLEKLTFSQLACLSISPVLMAWVVMLKAYLYSLRKADVRPYFMSDRELEETKDDLLEVKERADIFAERVLNGGSSESLVFGIDAPWGAGKSTFVNFCCTYWKDKSGVKPIIHRFEPLRYEEGVDLTEKFIDDLINTIQSHVFAPSLRPLFKRYESLVKDRKHASLLDIKRTLSLNKDTIESTLEEIDYVLKNLNTRIIVIVDDLDRLHWSSIKSILFSIKRSFRLSNLSYILCYDTTNINPTPESPDSEKTLEFLEKFVNIKTSLFLSSQDLARYVSQYFEQALEKAHNLSNEATEQLKGVTQELIFLFEGNRFHHYTPFIGDIRKIKRVINTLILLDIDKTDFSETDFNKRDLLHLVLIFIHYPAIFRKIYETETSGKSGTFSSIQENKLEPSAFYTKYKSQLKNENKEFLLEQTFEQLSNRPKSLDEPELASRACFQGERRALEKYLYLIAKLSKPISWDSYRFYANKKDELLTTSDIATYLDDISKTHPLNKETGQEEFWRVVAKHTQLLDSKKSTIIIDYLINTLHRHSLLRGHGLSEFRITAIRLMARLLDETITSDAKKTHPRLSPSEVAITNLVYGDRRNQTTGIIEKLISDQRGALGFHDLIAFRNFCITRTKDERLWKALAFHANENVYFQSSDKSTREQARELSQIIFGLFKGKYINNKKDIFHELDTTNDFNFFGLHASLYNEEEKTTDWNNRISSKRLDIKNAIINQFGNKVIGESGFYDEEGEKDKDGISNAFSKYLISVCFNLDEPHGYINFAEYLLSFTSSSSEYSGQPDYEPSLSSIERNLNMEDLREFWIENHERIKSQQSRYSDRVVHKTYSTPTFLHDLPPIYRALDKRFLQDTSPKSDD
ncbi:P-loop NTPase fold protein [Pseudomonas sp. B11(2017)]|uniref:P-loop NTPase fold protein n=1 Tax=Pseudomonas sp. B11(2017) TaxID=1981748 RepID=UPI000A1E6D57|nr:P-loop NTPase fold protein [Pseudomonas sp. B11(2017)]